LLTPRRLHGVPEFLDVLPGYVAFLVTVDLLEVAHHANPVRGLRLVYG